MMAKYINPFTGFGFKKIFGEEASKPLLLDSGQWESYERSLKEYRDVKGYIDTAFSEGRTEGKIEGKIEIALKMKQKGFSINEIAEMTGLSEDAINNL